MANAGKHIIHTGSRNESQPLLRDREIQVQEEKTCPAGFLKSKLCPKVVLGLLFCDFTFELMYLELMEYILLMSSIPRSDLLGLVIDAFILVSPIAGWIADAWVGRYKVIITCLLLSLVAWVATYTQFVIASLEGPLPLGIVTAVVGMLFFSLSYAGFRANMLPFMLDQCIGASSDELSSIVHWYYWFMMLAEITYKLLEPVLSLLIEILPIDKSYYKFYGSFTRLLLAFALLVLVIVTTFILRKWLDTHHRVSNPIKQVVSVLNYARKTKYPQRRSALTYFDEEEPLRLDFGKEKFGGPFSEEEVEDVRTVLHLMPLLICLIASGDIELSLTLLKKHMYNAIDPSVLVDQLFTYSQIFLFPVMTIIAIPLSLFILHPLLHNYIPSMLKRVGAGTLLCLIALIVFIVIDVVGHEKNKATVCMFRHNATSFQIPIDVHFSLLPSFFEQAGGLLIELYLLQFMIAQTPAMMKGFVIGLWYSGQAFADLFFTTLYIIFDLYYPYTVSSPSCGTVLLLIIFSVILFTSVTYLILAKHYKLRERERHVNIQAIAEEHYERYFDQEEEYMSARRRISGDTHVMNFNYQKNNCFVISPIVEPCDIKLLFINTMLELTIVFEFREAQNK